METEQEFLKLLEKEPKDRGSADTDIIQLTIRSLNAFHKYTTNQLTHFATAISPQILEAGQTLFEQGQEGSEWFVIFQGSVDIFVDGQNVVSFGAGSGFGERAIIENTPRTATVVAKENCILLKTPGVAFLAIQKEYEESLNSGPLEELEEVSESLPDLHEPENEDKNDDDLSVYNFRARRGSTDTLKDLKMVLDMRPEERGPDDIFDLLDEISRIKAFSHLSSSILRELCTCLTSQYVQPNTTLFKQGDEGTCWYIIYKGRVEVIVNGVTVCTLSDGDGFGELALINDKPRSATVKVIEESQFIKIEKEDYNRILKDIESNTIRLEEHGKEVIVLEKRTDPIAKTTGYIVMAATPERLVRQLEETNEADPTYGFDFLLSFRIFMKPLELMEILSARVKTTPDDGEDAEKSAQSKSIRQKRIASVLKWWVTNHTSDFISEPSLVDGVLSIVDIFEADNLLAEKNKVLNAMEMKKLDLKGRVPSDKVQSPLPASPDVASPNPLASEEPGKITLRKRSSNMMPGIIKRGLRMSARGTSKETLENSPDIVSNTHEKDSVQIFTATENFVTVDVFPMTTAAQLLTLALEKFNIKDLDYELVEFKSDGTTRAFDPEEVSLPSKLCLNGKFLLRKKGTDVKLPILSETSLPSESIFLDLDSSELARIATLMDHQLFCLIDSLEFINHIYKVKGKDTSNLNRFVNQFNRMNYWVVTEICSETNLQRRVSVIKKFIKMALLFKAMNNYNSLFAVLSGLSNVAVSRMSSTWKKVPSKLVDEYELLQKLMDPSRNMKVYRSHLLNATPPLVPFFPIVIKDLFFIHECNPSKTSSGLINFDKLRLLTSIIRFMDAFRYVQYDPHMQPKYDPNKRRSTLEMVNENNLEKVHEVAQIKDFLTNRLVVDNMRILSHLSREAETPAGRSKRSGSIQKIILGL